VDRAIAVLKDRHANTAAKWGAGHFVCEAEQFDERPYSRYLRYQQSAMLQGLVGPMLPPDALSAGGIAQPYLRRTTIEPGLSIASALQARRVSLTSLGIDPATLPRQVLRVLEVLGVVTGAAPTLDIIGEIIEARYGVRTSGHWQRLLGAEYVHAMGLLVQADVAFFSGRSYWLSHLNSFNQVLFLQLQDHLAAKGQPGVVTTRNVSGELLDYGVTLQAGNAFSKAYPAIADCFRSMNVRRNKLPGSHPYDKKTAAQTRYLAASERNRFVAQLRKAYAEVLPLCP
jgi:hypothetical protein